MKKVVVIFGILLVVLSICICKLIVNTSKQKEEINLLNSYEFDGMQVTVLGGSNMVDKGNINSMGYIIRNRRGELIIVDGGQDIDTDLVYSYIEKYGNGKVDYWYLTHAHLDHIGALIKLLNENYNIEIENLYYHFLDLEWYEKNDKRGYETEKAMIESLSNPKIKNKIECAKDQVIQMDNIRCDIIRIANPEITNSDNGNEVSMTFKFTAEDVDKSIIFLGDSMTKASKELLEVSDKLKADAVQMAHHGQSGVTKEVYNAIAPKICLFNCPKWLYENDNGEGVNSGKWKSLEVRAWLEEMGCTNVVAYEGDQTLHFAKDGIYKCVVND